jgi:transcription termination/antitermination protein NusA
MEILKLIQSISDGKNLEPVYVFEALEKALETIFKAKLPEQAIVRVRINKQTGILEAFRVYRVVSQVHDDVTECALDVARQEHPNVAIHHTIEVSIGVFSYGQIGSRIDMHRTKHLINQTLRQAVYQQTCVRFKNKIGHLITGTVQRVLRDALHIALDDGLETMIYRDKLIPGDLYRAGDTIKAALIAVSTNEHHGSPLILSRSDVMMRSALFNKEIPEIQEGVVTIVGIAFKPGLLCKVAVKTNDRRVDPVGACIGQRSIRIQSISNQLAGEKIDVVAFDDDLKSYCEHAIGRPIHYFDVSTVNKTIIVGLHAEDVPFVIGKNGLNIRLAGQLLGYNIRALPKEDIGGLMKEERFTAIRVLQDTFHWEPELAMLWATLGCKNPDDVPKIDLSQLSPEYDKQQATLVESQTYAIECLLERTLVDMQQYEEACLTLPGMTSERYAVLLDNGLRSLADIADLSVHELQTLLPNIDENTASHMILTARRQDTT